jgi:hypothetical protein
MAEMMIRSGGCLDHLTWTFAVQENDDLLHMQMRRQERVVAEDARSAIRSSPFPYSGRARAFFPRVWGILR